MKGYKNLGIQVQVDSVIFDISQKHILARQNTTYMHNIMTLSIHYSTSTPLMNLNIFYGRNNGYQEQLYL